MRALLFVLIVLVGLFVKKRIKVYDVIIIIFLCFLSYSAVRIADFENYKAAYNYIGLRT